MGENLVLSLLLRQFDSSPGILGFMTQKQQKFSNKDGLPFSGRSGRRKYCKYGSRYKTFRDVLNSD